jgi:hypothetical protein
LRQIPAGFDGTRVAPQPYEELVMKRTTTAVCVLLAIAAFYLWTEHRGHMLGALPYLLLLACPIIHLFMHREHGKHGAKS